MNEGKKDIGKIMEEMLNVPLELIEENKKLKKKIKKLQKENTELKYEAIEKELIIDGMKEDRRIAVEEIQEQYYVSKDKIKEKIKELQLEGTKQYWTEEVISIFKNILEENK